MATGELWISGSTLLVYDSLKNRYRAITHHDASYRQREHAPQWAKDWQREQQIIAVLEAENEYQRRIKENTRTYDYSPFAIVQTDHKTFMSIQALEHEENTYNAGLKKYPYCAKRWQEWKQTFEYLQPYKIGSIQVWKNPHAKPMQFSLQNGKWNIKR
ncbi:MAG: hypothetical protein VX313_01960 [Bacteroidota bacterium]|nr:hypothetical protein [Bacteroidota bacterium]MEC7659622.1 hypothetical protein [Bacteroidota bacterium]MED5363374.1 hypothetical protein [Bacteroidota bacterium]MEE3019996.1 hypothetical protein [Bacteroidota bacterium]